MKHRLFPALSFLALTEHSLRHRPICRQNFSRSQPLSLGRQQGSKGNCPRNDSGHQYLCDGKGR